MIYQKELKLHVGYLHNLRNEEFSSLISEVVAIAEAFSFDEALIQAQLEQLQEDEEVLMRLDEAPTSHPNTVLIDKEFAQMRGLLIGMKNTIQGLQYLPAGPLKRSALVLSNWIEHVREEMSSPTKGRALYAVGVLRHLYETEPEIASAVEQLGLSVVYTHIVAARQQVGELMSSRLSDKTELSTMREDLRKRVMFNLEMFFNSLQSMVNLNGKEAPAYYTLCTRMEQVMVAALAIQKARATRSRNKREREEEQEDTAIQLQNTNQDVADLSPDQLQTVVATPNDELSSDANLPLLASEVGGIFPPMLRLPLEDGVEPAVGIEPKLGALD